MSKVLDKNVLSFLKKSAVYPQYATFESRLETFDCWPIEYFLPKKTVAECGFFYSDKSTDECRCFSCGGLLKNFEPHEDPFVLHSLFYFNCKYINYTVGSDYVSNVLREKKADTDLLRCKICMDNLINTIVWPCKHVSTCDLCTRRIGACPMCRVPILKDEIVYLN